MIVLGIDCSSKSASAALSVDGKIMCEQFLNVGLTHSQTLMTLIDNCFQNTSIKTNDVDMIAITNGPGSFTGVRIGLACAKGIAFTNNKKCCPVSTLEALAVNVRHFTGKIYSVLDARCSQVYFAEFESDGHCLNRLCEDCAITLEELKNKAKCEKSNIILVGDGADLCFNFVSNECSNVIISDEALRFTKASSVCAIVDTENSVEADVLVPNYLRLPQAQRNLKKGN